MNGVVLLVGGLLLVAVIKLIMDRNWLGLLLCVVALLLVCLLYTSELLCQIGNRSDKKTLKRLGTLKDYADNWGNHYALPKPKTPEEKQNEKERRTRLGLPTFRYHPDPCLLYTSRCV